MTKVRVDFSHVEEIAEAIKLCVLAFGRVEGSRSFFLPSGEHAQDAFDREVDAAWKKLSPKQQKAVLDGRFKIKVPTLFQVLGHNLATNEDWLGDELP